MKIRSNFKDYYDSGLVYGADSELMYVREEEKIIMKLNDSHRTSYSSKHMGLLDIGSSGYYRQHDAWIGNDKVTKLFYYAIIGFCGKLYPVIHVYPNKLHDKSKNFYNSNDFDKYIQENNITISQASLYEKKGKPSQFFSNNNDWKELEKIFIQENTPIFVYDGNYSRDEKSHNIYNINVDINTELKKYDFFKIFDPNLAYQELSVYLGGVLKKPEKPMLQISDKDKINQHGFDPKYGFRKTPEKAK